MARFLYEEAEGDGGCRHHFDIADKQGKLAKLKTGHFDVDRALSLPGIRQIVAKREEVLGRFGRLFRNPVHLTKEDYLDFLSFQHNHHWTGLERVGRTVTDDMENLRGALAILVDETRPLAERFDATLTSVSGLGVATITSILLVAYPDRYGVWNGTSEHEMRERALWPDFPVRITQGQKYEQINAILVEVAEESHVDLWTLDALWWADKIDRKNAGYHVSKWGIAIWEMATQAKQTAKYANGQLVERTLKNKDIRISKEALIRYLEVLLGETGYCCAITQIPLQPDGNDNQLRPSLDRIDSNGHYEIGNLQVVARFVNKWKQDTPDAEFRRLLALVRGE